MWGRFIDVFRRRRLDADLDAQLAHHLEAGPRRREIGLRLALGAPRISIVWHFLRQGVRVVSLACLCGLAMSAAGSRLLSAMLYGVSTSDPATLSGVVAIVLAVAALAALVPATRAAFAEPMRIFRE